jgi:DNA-binding transcriptional LysR family regulator
VVVNSDLLTVLPRHFVPTTGMSHELVLHELPFDVPPVQVHALWHRKRQQDSTHQWLRTQLQQVAQQAFDGQMLTTAMTTTDNPASDIPT